MQSGDLDFPIVAGTYDTLGLGAYNASIVTEHPYTYYEWGTPDYGVDMGVGDFQAMYYDWDYLGHSATWFPEGGYDYDFFAARQDIYIAVD